MPKLFKRPPATIPSYSSKIPYMNSRVTTAALIGLFLLGICLVAYPSVADLVNSYTQSRAIATYDDAVAGKSEQERDAFLQEADQYNQDLAQSQSQLGFSRAYPERYAQVEIPKVNVSLPIYHGVTDSVLSSAIGHLEWSSLLVRGVRIENPSDLAEIAPSDAQLIPRPMVALVLTAVGSIIASAVALWRTRKSRRSTADKDEYTDSTRLRLVLTNRITSPQVNDCLTKSSALGECLVCGYCVYLERFQAKPAEREVYAVPGHSSVPRGGSYWQKKCEVSL